MSVSSFLPAAGWFILVLVLICIPGDSMPNTSAWGLFLESVYFDKWVHAVLFGVLHFLILYPFLTVSKITVWGTRITAVITLSCILWGFVTECIQLYIPGRDFDFADWIADTAGIIVSLLLCIKWKKTDPNATT
ncbi:MAG: VanZ family protein [Ferruginibacter sp.]